MTMRIGFVLLAITCNAVLSNVTGEDVLSNNIRGRKLLTNDPRTVVRKASYSLQQDTSGVRDEFEQQSASHAESQVERAQGESDVLMAQGGGRLQNQISSTTMQQQGSQVSAQQQGLSLAKQSQQMLSSSMQDNPQIERPLRTDDQLQQVGAASPRLQSNPELSRVVGTVSSLEQGSTFSNEDNGDDQSMVQKEQQQQSQLGSQSLMQKTQSTPAQMGRNLEFIHITKSAGSAIEAAAAKHNIMWGACHYWKISYLGCQTPDWDFPKKRLNERMPAGLVYQGEPWHAPPHWNYPNMLEGSDTFLVVRNPYERIISEYYCSAFGYKGEDRENPIVFNNWLAGNLTLLGEKLQGHMLPQHYYVYDENGDRVVTHILRFENLQPEFDSLMEQYGLPVRLPPKSSKTVFHFRGKAKDEEKINVNSISPENILKINEVYSRDFEYFGYPTIKVTPGMSMGTEDSTVSDNQKVQQQTTRISNSQQQLEPMDQTLDKGMMSRGNEQAQQQIASGVSQTQNLNEDGFGARQQQTTLSERQVGGNPGGGLNQLQSSVQQDMNVVRNSNVQVTEQLVTQNGVNTAMSTSGQLQQSAMIERQRDGNLGAGGLNQVQASVRDELNVVRSSQGQVSEQLVSQSGPNAIRTTGGQLQQSQLGSGNEVSGMMGITGIDRQQNVVNTDSLELNSNPRQVLPASRSQQGNVQSDGIEQERGPESTKMLEQTSRMMSSSVAGNEKSSQSELSSGASTRGSLRSGSNF